MRCNKISTIKDKPTRYSIETSSFRFVQFLKKKQNLIAIGETNWNILLRPEMYSRKLEPFLKVISLASLVPMGNGLTPGHFFCLGWQTTGDGDP